MRLPLPLLLVTGLLPYLFTAPLRAEDYGECMQRCDGEYSDCINQPPAPEPEVQAVKQAACDKNLAMCQAECDYLKPVEPPTPIENNPNIIRR